MQDFELVETIAFANRKLSQAVGIIRKIEYHMKEEEKAVALFNTVLDIFDGEVETDNDGAFLPKHARKVALSARICEWINATKMRE